MVKTLAIYLYLSVLATIAQVRGQYGSCDYHQELKVGQTYSIYSPGFPNHYTANKNCRWKAIAPAGHSILLSCPTFEIPASPNCRNDRVLISESGDSDLNDAGSYCGTGSLSQESTSGKMVVALRVPNSTKGGRFLCSISAKASTSTCKCGARKRSRIVGGTESLVNEFPLMAGVVSLADRKVYCGATIIAVLYALTAAHCVYNKLPGDIALLVGDHNTSSSAESPFAALYMILELITHPNFHSKEKTNDIALIKTTQTIRYNDGVGPACLPFKFATRSFAGARVEALGWGTTQFGGQSSDVLMKVKLDVITEQQCKPFYNKINSTQICTYTTNKDACQNDSGGPLLYTDASNGLVYNIGIISYGVGCAQRYPSVNANVSSYLNWITTSTPDVGYCVT